MPKDFDPRFCHPPTWEKTPKDERLKIARMEAMKGRPIPYFLPKLVFEIGEDTAITNHAEAKVLMKTLRPKFRNLVEEVEVYDPEDPLVIKLDIPLELFQHLLKWIQIHGLNGRGLVTQQLQKLDMKNLIAYTKIYLQGDGIVEKAVLKNIIEYVKGLVMWAPVQEFSDFTELANSPHSRSEDKKFEVLKRLL